MLLFGGKFVIGVIVHFTNFSSSHDMSFNISIISVFDLNVKIRLFFCWPSFMTDLCLNATT